MKEPAEICPGCDQAVSPDSVGNVAIGVLKKTPESDVSATTPYCSDCGIKILDMDTWDLCDDLDLVIRRRLGKPIPISEELVREISMNLGATKKVEEALIERIFGKDWTGPPPEDSGLVMNRYANRDRLVAMKLKDLWTLKS